MAVAFSVAMLASAQRRCGLAGQSCAMLVVKLSGKALHNEQALGALFGQLKAQGQQALVVHGGGVEVDQILQALNFTSTKKDGIRVSPREQMPYIAGTLAGQCNKLLQGVAIKSGLKAVGMLCTDYDLCTLTPYAPEYGQVASCQAHDITLINLLLSKGITPVISSIGLNAQGELYNINADEVAAALAIAFHAPLVFFSDVPGVLDGNGEVIDTITEATALDLMQSGVIKEGMAVKVKNALNVAHSSGAPVFIASIFDEQALAHLSTLRRIGTTLSA